VAALRFEWDPRKNAINLRRHGVSFEEAESVFTDELAILTDDPEHSVEEERFVLLGRSSALRFLVVVHCYRSGGNVIRVISARRANRRERETYETRWKT
jgi:hypothetical protein